MGRITLYGRALYRVSSVLKKLACKGKQKLNLLPPAESFTPKQIEYDWVGDNIFVLEGKGNIWACGRTNGACVRVVTQRDTLDGEVRFALDPKRG